MPGHCRHVHVQFLARAVMVQCPPVGSTVRCRAQGVGAQWAVLPCILLHGTGTPERGA